MKKYTIKELEYLTKRMADARHSHPKADIYYDSESLKIIIAYPLPKDFNKADGFKLTKV